MNALPRTNLRDERNLAPVVGLKPSKTVLYPVLPAPRTAAQIHAQREFEEAEIKVLEALRASALLSGTTDAVVAFDHKLAVSKIRLDQLKVQYAAASDAEAEAEAAYEAEQKRRLGLHRKATKASAEVAKLADQYAIEAQRLVPLLEQIRERAALIEAANFALPEGVELVPTGEPRVSWNDSPDQPHSSIANRVKLPGLGRDASPIW